MSLEFALNEMRSIRGFTLKSLEDLSEEQLLAVPEPFNNNIVWNAAHVLVSQCRLIFGLAGHPLPVPEHYLAYFAKDTSPAKWPSVPDIAEVRGHLEAASDIVEKAVQDGTLGSFKPVLLPIKVTAQSLEDVIQFHNFHEGLHLGTISALRRFV